MNLFRISTIILYILRFKFQFCTFVRVFGWFSQIQVYKTVYFTENHLYFSGEPRAVKNEIALPLYNSPPGVVK